MGSRDRTREWAGASSAGDPSPSRVFIHPESIEWAKAALARAADRVRRTARARDELVAARELVVRRVRELERSIVLHDEKLKRNESALLSTQAAVRDTVGGRGAWR